jgi:glycosyltransferase involved in cell wall biosynthesis
MRAAFYSPYLDTLGGGERYVISAAKVLNDHGWDVSVESKDKAILQKLEKRFDLDLSGIKVTGSIKRGDGYDLCFWLSDGSVPTLFARRNILHFQRPFSGVDGKSLINRMKFFRINRVVVNSEFTKSFIDREYPCETVVLYPPVDVEKFKPGKKENLILYVGRFSQLEQSKRQDVLVTVFKKFYDSFGHGWKMVLAGGSGIGRTKFVDKLKKSGTSYPVRVVENPSFKEIKNLYSRAKIFWSAAGYGVDEKRLPQKVEHFGISLVEAMAAGCVPLAYNAGGHREIIKDGMNGKLWNTKGDLLGFTRDLIENSADLRKISLNAVKDSFNFSYARFEANLLKLV